MKPDSNTGPAASQHRASERDSGGAAHSGLVDDDGRPTAKYQAYLAHQDAYLTEVRARDEARAAARQDARSLQDWPLTGREHTARVEAALTRWETLGFKAHIEAALSRGRRRGGGPAPGAPK
jgi:hypothetical protein